MPSPARPRQTIFDYVEVVMIEAVQDDYPEHVRGYKYFVRGVRLVVAGLAILLLLLAFFLL